MRGDNSIALVSSRKFRAVNENVARKENQRRVRGPDNRALARKTSGLRSNGCKR
jgi:hypothetical protein